MDSPKDEECMMGKTLQNYLNTLINDKKPLHRIQRYFLGLASPMSGKRGLVKKIALYINPLQVMFARLTATKLVTH